MDHYSFFRAMICLLSAIVSLVFASVIFTLRRSAGILQEKKWATPFALTFFVLAGIYFLRFFNLLAVDHIPKDIAEPLAFALNLIISACSGVTNYLFFRSAFLLSEPALDERRLRPFKKWLIDRAYASLSVLCLAGLIKIAGQRELIDGWLRVLSRVPDAIFSALALFFMGIVLYRNISSRRDKLMARVALLSSVGYSVLYPLVALGLIRHLVAGVLPGGDPSRTTDLLTFLVFLVLKFGLFFPGYSLMLSVSGPLEGIERLLKNVTRKQKEYLESDGIVRSICEELHLNSVGLYIKLPGSTDNQLELYTYPPKANGNYQEPEKLKYEEGTDYDRVMKSGEPVIRNRDNYPYWLIRRMIEVTVPIYFHNSVVACLRAEIGEERFTEADLSNLKRIATMVSPAVQAYREMTALNKISQTLAELQLRVVKYDLGQDVEQITEIIHDVVSPLATGISIEIGFQQYRAIYPKGALLEGEIHKQLDTEVVEEDFTNGAHRWLKRELKFSMGDSSYGKVGDHAFGKFVLLTEKKKRTNEPPTLGTNPACRRAVSDLLTDMLLDFVRGYLNQLTDILGIRLSGLKGTTAADWLKEVEETAQQANLLWAVAINPDDGTLLGEEKNVEIISKLNSAGQKEKWETKVDDDLWIYSLDQPEAEAYVVIKKVLKKSQTTLWLAVARRGFGLELDYVSPWRYFLDHFCEIADSALLRILMKKHEEERNMHLAIVHSIAFMMITTANAIHDLKNLAMSIKDPMRELEVAVKEGRLMCSDTLKKLILSFEPTRLEIEELLKTLKENERRPCSLDDAVMRVCERVERLLNGSNIKIEKPKPLGASINIPFHAAIFALAAITDNAKEALKGVDRDNKWIRIELDETAPDKVFCYITDNGPGIPPHLRSKILNGVSPSHKSNGHGVGLYFSALLLRGYGGDIILAPEGPEPGARFRIQFPK